MKSIDTIKPVFYITEDNKKIIKEIENTNFYSDTDPHYRR